MKKNKNQGLIYSTEFGAICPRCSHPVKKCSCSKNNPQTPRDGIIRISRQTKGRKGSGVCLISGVPLGEAELKILAKQLKKKCGSGGTVSNGIIEIQGEHRKTLLDALTALGYKVKIAGG
ncbi:MAG: translation initiation factor Sui1 [Desulfobulbaceae bacterium]|nr:translation initiation factor Sui1 [Desulfobulbaceae bacterium]